jgi:lipopolysaccharide export system permease protein
MQFLWVYADDLIGKGLSPWVIGELMMYASARLVNLGLPLAILIASIMAMGSLAEKNELTALKSAGLSLPRIMRPLTLAMIHHFLRSFLVFECRLAGCKFEIPGVALFRDKAKTGT